MSLDQLFFLVVLMAASVIGLTFIIERGLALRASKIMPSEVLSALGTFRTVEDLPMLRRLCQQHPSPLARLLLVADKHRHYSRDENTSGLETAARKEVSRLERGLVILEIVVGVSPLLGLLGTVWGLITLFATLGPTGLGDNSVLANGIALALRATFLGLFSAIPSLVAWSYYSKKVETMAVEMASLCDEFLGQLYHQDDATDDADAADAVRHS
jgi:biopolymer transport protein ExbB